jgi:hypothetical protein
VSIVAGNTCMDSKSMIWVKCIGKGNGALSEGLESLLRPHSLSFDMLARRSRTCNWYSYVNDHLPESAVEDSHAMISLAHPATVLPQSDSPSPQEWCINSIGKLSKSPTHYQNQN